MPEPSTIPSFTSQPMPCPLPVSNPTKSFWHSEPDSFLLGHRTTSDLPKFVETIIIGSGITGASAARYLDLLYDKKDLLMLESREACWGATGRVSEAKARSHLAYHKCFIILVVHALLYICNLTFRW
jgi:hypothetical protein